MRVTSLQGEYAKNNLPGPIRGKLDSVIYQREGVFLIKSSAVIYILGDMKWYLKPLRLFLIFPKFFRDGLYNFVAKRRYRFFGRKKICRMPTEQEKSYFLP